VHRPHGLVVLGCLAMSLLGRAVVPARSFQPSIGYTRAQVESAFHAIGGTHTVFEAAGPVRGVPRVLGRDRALYAVVEVNGYPEVVDVQVVAVLDTHDRATLERQVEYASLACGELAGPAAQKWCIGRILNTNAKGLKTATGASDFGALRITVKTYQSPKAAQPPVVSIDIGAV